MRRHCQPFYDGKDGIPDQSCPLVSQAVPIGPEPAPQFAAALALPQGREADPVDPGSLVGADLAALVRLQEVPVVPTQRSRLNAVLRAVWRWMQTLLGNRACPAHQVRERHGFIHQHTVACLLCTLESSRLCTARPLDPRVADGTEASPGDEASGCQPWCTARRLQGWHQRRCVVPLPKPGPIP